MYKSVSQNLADTTDIGTSNAMFQSEVSKHIQVYIKEWMGLFASFINETFLPGEKEYTKTILPKLITYTAFSYNILSKLDASTEEIWQFQKSINIFCKKLDGRRFIEKDKALLTQSTTALPTLVELLRGYFASNKNDAGLINKQKLEAFGQFLAAGCPSALQEIDMQAKKKPILSREFISLSNDRNDNARCRMNKKQNDKCKRDNPYIEKIEKNVQEYFIDYCLFWYKEEDNYFVVPANKTQKEIGIKLALWNPNPSKRSIVSFAYREGELLPEPCIILGID